MKEITNIKECLCLILPRVTEDKITQGYVMRALVELMNLDEELKAVAEALAGIDKTLEDHITYMEEKEMNKDEYDF